MRARQRHGGSGWTDLRWNRVLPIGGGHKDGGNCLRSIRFRRFRRRAWSECRSHGLVSNECFVAEISATLSGADDLGPVLSGRASAAVTPPSPSPSPRPQLKSRRRTTACFRNQALDHYSNHRLDLGFNAKLRRRRVKRQVIQLLNFAFFTDFWVCVKISLI
jgi:hypothetical protein